MSHQDLLPDELLWAEGGHASDIVLTSLGDGQHAIVPAVVRAHVERCTACTAHLGHAALLSLHVETELAARAEHERAEGRKPVPRMAVALGLLVAALGLVPSLLSGSPQGLLEGAPLFLRGLGTLLHRAEASPAWLVLTYGGAVLLLAMGLAVVRLLPKKETSS